MQFRVIKMKVAEDSYEYIITNLPHSFDLEDLKTCYHPCVSMLYVVLCQDLVQVKMRFSSS